MPYGFVMIAMTIEWMKMMSKIIITLNLDNVAMQDPLEIAHILGDLSNDFANDTTGLDEYFTYQVVQDSNGNTVGNIQLVEDESNDN